MLLRMHIEQGPVLPTQVIDVGIVTAIFGIRRLEIVFTDEAAHAGTAPMHLRRDPPYAGALAIENVRERAAALAEAVEGYYIAGGRGHDAAVMAGICPSAMIFSPCLRGTSHTPDEGPNPPLLPRRRPCCWRRYAASIGPAEQARRTPARVRPLRPPPPPPCAAKTRRPVPK